MLRDVQAFIPLASRQERQQEATEAKQEGQTCTLNTKQVSENRELTAIALEPHACYAHQSIRQNNPQDIQRKTARARTPSQASSQDCAAQPLESLGCNVVCVPKCQGCPHVDA